MVAAGKGAGGAGGVSVPAYPAYRDSGVAWLGEVPRHWNVAPLKHVASFAGGGTPSREVPAFWNGDVPWVSPKDMKSEVIRDSEERITEAGLAAGAASLIEPNAVLIVVRSGILRHTIPVAINERPVALNQDMKALRLDGSRCQPGFVLRLVQGMNDLFLNLWLKQGATVESIEHDFLARTEIPLPPPAEQRAIAAFLDRECGKIDGLVAEQERLIGLLKEKRQAVISHAVTKGLDPNALMKDSGLAWLGQVPAHWEVKRLKFLVRPGTRISYGIVQPGEHQDDGVPFVQTTNMSSGDFDLERLQRTTPEIAAAYPRTCLEGGEVLLGIRASIGAAYTAPHHLRGANLSRGVARIVCDEPIASDFLVAALRSDAVAEYWALMQQGSTFNEVSIETVRELAIAVPPLDEQTTIVGFVAFEERAFSSLTTEAERAIALLKERRGALISAAVTGKIDVRGLVAPSEAQAA